MSSNSAESAAAFATSVAAAMRMATLGLASLSSDQVPSDLNATFVSLTEDPPDARQGQEWQERLRLAWSRHGKASQDSSRNPSEFEALATRVLMVAAWACKASDDNDVSAALRWLTICAVYSGALYAKAKPGDSVLGDAAGINSLASIPAVAANVRSKAAQKAAESRHKGHHDDRDQVYKWCEENDALSMSNAAAARSIKDQNKVLIELRKITDHVRDWKKRRANM